MLCGTSPQGRSVGQEDTEGRASLEALGDTPPPHRDPQGGRSMVVEGAWFIEQALGSDPTPAADWPFAHPGTSGEETVHVRHPQGMTWGGSSSSTRITCNRQKEPLPTFPLEVSASSTI